MTNKSVLGQVMAWHQTRDNPLPETLISWCIHRSTGVRIPRTSLLPPFSLLNTLRPRQNGRHFADDIFKCIFLNENVWTPIKISLKFVPKGPINNIQALVQIMAWRRLGDKPLPEPKMVSLLAHICVTRPQWVKWSKLWDLCVSFNHRKPLKQTLVKFESKCEDFSPWKHIWQCCLHNGSNLSLPQCV